MIRVIMVCDIYNDEDFDLVIDNDFEDFEEFETLEQAERYADAMRQRIGDVIAYHGNCPNVLKDVYIDSEK